MKNKITLFLIIICSLVFCSCDSILFQRINFLNALNKYENFENVKITTETFDHTFGSFNDDANAIQTLAEDGYSDKYSFYGTSLIVKTNDNNQKVINNKFVIPDKYTIIGESNKYNGLIYVPLTYEITTDRFNRFTDIYIFDEGFTHVNTINTSLFIDRINVFHDGLYVNSLIRSVNTPTSSYIVDLKKFEKDGTITDTTTRINERARLTEGVGIANNYGVSFKREYIFDNITYFIYHNSLFKYEDGQISLLHDEETVLMVDEITKDRYSYYFYKTGEGGVPTLYHRINEEVEEFVKIEGLYTWGKHAFTLKNYMIFPIYSEHLKYSGLLFIDKNGEIKKWYNEYFHSSRMIINYFIDYSQNLIFPKGNDKQITRVKIEF